MQLAARRGNGASVFVDYAHTPDAVETALRALRPHVMGRIIAILGAGGDRDRTKRPLMGAAAARHADVVIVTDDNPRSEDPAAIRAAVMDGVRERVASSGPARWANGPRRSCGGVDALGPGDALLVCGKGHETGQIVGNDIFPSTTRAGSSAWPCWAAHELGTHRSRAPRAGPPAGWEAQACPSTPGRPARRPLRGAQGRATGTSS
jgi:UDP-N-acetylmuramyl tripeptide synthase